MTELRNRTQLTAEHSRPAGPVIYDDQDDDEDEPIVRQQRTPASPLKRAITFMFVGLLFAVVYVRLQHKAEERKNKVIYAKRYSEEFKFRPAASPIITESLKGGGTKLRGAMPTPTPIPTPPTEKKKRRRRNRKSKTPKN